MKNLSATFETLLTAPDGKKKIIIGALLSFVPIVNFFALGFLFRYAERISNDKNYELPEWEDWPGLFIQGLWGLVVLVLYAGIPLMAGWLIGLVFEVLSGGLLGWFGYFPLSVIAVFVPSLVVVGFLVLASTKRLEKLVSGCLDYIKKIARMWHVLLVPNLAFMGLLFLGLPLYGLAFFVGFVVLIPYTARTFYETCSEEACCAPELQEEDKKEDE